MQRFHAALFAALVVLVSGATSLAAAAFFQAHNYGVSLPQGPAVFETSLQSRISASDTSMTIVANSVRGGSTLAGYQCFTIDEGRTDMEYVCGTVSGTSVTNLERGIDPLTATSTNNALKFAHRVGANVKITDFPLIQRLRNLSNGAETFPNPLFLDVATTTISGLGTSTIPTKEYVDYVGTSGCSDASVTARGCVELATQVEAASSTMNGATGAQLAIPASIATSSPYTTGFWAVITNNAGKIAHAFLDLSQEFDFSGTLKDSGVEGGFVPVGSIQAYASSTAPTGWLYANGAAVSRTTYASLFSVIGTTYGVGDGSTTFNLPDLRGRNVIGFGSATTTFDQMGEKGGEDQHVLTVGEIPAHTHSYNDPLTAGGANGPDASNGGGSVQSGSTGGGGAHNVMDPFIVLYFIIKH